MAALEREALKVQKCCSHIRFKGSPEHYRRTCVMPVELARSASPWGTGERVSTCVTTVRGHFGAHWGHLVAVWSHLGTLLGPCWGHRRPISVHLRVVLAIWGPAWGRMGAILNTPGAIRAILGPSRAIAANIEKNLVCT